jgi:hypothetical protein
MLGVGLVEISILLSQLAPLGGWLWGILSAAGFPTDAYRARGLNKSWVIVGVVVVPLAFVIYALFIRPRLNSFVARPAGA